jgi:NADPH2:quinone reductase
LYREEDVALRIREITGGSGVEVVYDAIGADTFQGSLAALSFCGHLVNYGQASGPVDPVALSTLAARSLSLSRPILFHYMRTPDLLAALARETFAAFADGIIQPLEPLAFSLDEAAEAHRVLESGRSPGAIVLIP